MPEPASSPRLPEPEQSVPQGETLDITSRPEVRIDGKTLVEGITMAKALLINDMGSDLIVDRSKIHPEDVEQELALFDETLAKVIENLDSDTLYDDPKNALRRDYKKSIVLHKKRNERIRTLIRDCHNVKNAIDQVYSADQESADELAPDLEQLRSDLLTTLTGTKCETLALLESTKTPYVLCAQRISSEVVYAAMKGGLQGIVVGDNSSGAHFVLVAEANSIPTLSLDVSDIRHLIDNGNNLILDGLHQSLYINPDARTIRLYEHSLGARQAQGKTKITSPLLTRDQLPVHILSCISSFEGEADEAVEYGSGGLGLIRSEIAFFQHFRSSPHAVVEELTEVYRSLFTTFAGLPVQIRTFDFTSDKAKDVVREVLESEIDSTTLGTESVRSLVRKYFIEPQIQAVLRASVDHSDARIYFPNIGTSERFLSYWRSIEQQKGLLQAQGITFNDRLEVGAMIESPEGIRNANRILNAGARFLCIGSNDLLRTVTGGDRQSDNMIPCNPSVLDHMLQLNIQDLKRRHAVSVHVCGNLAKPAYMPLLIAMGFDEVSALTKEFGVMSQVIGSVSKADCDTLLQDVLREESGDIVRKILANFYHEKGIEVNL